MSNTIRLKGCGRYEEALANAILSPGHLIEILSTGKVRKHATEGGLAERAFAIEDALQGKTVADAYAADDRVGYVLAAPGDEINAVVKAGENVAIGDKLISAGDGTLIKTGSASTSVTDPVVVAVAMEAADLSDTGDVDTLVAVRVL